MACLKHVGNKYCIQVLSKRTVNEYIRTCTSHFHGFAPSATPTTSFQRLRLHGGRHLKNGSRLRYLHLARYHIDCFALISLRVLLGECFTEAGNNLALAGRLLQWLPAANYSAEAALAAAIARAQPARLRGRHMANAPQIFHWRPRLALLQDLPPTKE